jgi:hypothetical protein
VEIRTESAKAVVGVASNISNPKVRPQHLAVIEKEMVVGVH